MDRFDTFSKPMQEFQVKTKTGGYISICTVITIAYLLICEFFFFLRTDQKDEMLVMNM